MSALITDGIRANLLEEAGYDTQVLEFVDTTHTPKNILLRGIKRTENVSGKDAIIQLHNQYVSEGYEGLVIRDPNEKYKCGARDKRMLKVKMFQDDEFEITGMTDGLREEDFVFNMKTKDGYPFEAKPMGDRALKK